LPFVIVEMLLFASNFQMTAARKVARDPLFLDDLLDTIERSQRRRVHPPRPFASVHRHKLLDPQLHAGQHHSAVARTGTPSNRLRLKYGHAGSAPGQRARRREPGEASTDHRYIHGFRDWTR